MRTQADLVPDDRLHLQYALGKALARAVRTVSSEQVRRPIFRGGLEQWRHYDPWLGPLRPALGPALENGRGGAISPS